MNIEEHLLVTLAEEAAELQKVVAKALRFGLDDTWRDAEYTDSPRALILKELNDLMAVAELLAQKETLPWPLIQGDLIEAKKLKVRKFFNYSREQGRLEDNPQLEHSLATTFVTLQRERYPTERQRLWAECLRLAGELERLNDTPTGND